MNDIEKFKEAIKPYWDGWKSVDIRTICFLAYGTWINLGTRLFLLNEAPATPSDKGTLPTLPNFCALHEVRDIEELHSLLAQIEKGTLALAGKEIHFGKIEANAVKIVPPNFTFIKYRRGTPYFHIDFPYVCLVHGGESIISLLNAHSEALIQEELDWKLRSLKAPYNGLEDLIINFLGIPRPISASSQLALTEVIAPLGLRLGRECALSKGKVTVHVESVGTLKADAVSIGLIALSGTTPGNRVSYELVKEDWGKDCCTAYKQMSVGAASSVVIFLSFKGNTIDMQTVADPAALLNNPRILAYAHFDDELSVFKEYLLGKGGDQSRDFEIGVGLLLHFCGFNVGPYGRVKALQAKSIQEEIDHIAFTPFNNHIVAVECTKKDLDTDGKLSKFSRRVKELKDILPDFTIIPLICTPLSREKIANTEIQKADSEKIAVVAAEEIQSILEMAGQNKEPEAILEYLRGLIKNPDDTLFWST